jgi:hypothetical protein
LQGTNILPIFAARKEEVGWEPRPTTGSAAISDANKKNGNQTKNRAIVKIALKM